MQAADFAIKQGSSAKSILRLANQKGYFLAATTLCNLILVDENYKTAVAEGEFSTLDALRDDTEQRTFIFFGYDGTLLSNRESVSIPWHRITLHPRQMQLIPRYLRQFGEDYSFFQKLLFALFVLVRFPGSFRGLFREKIMNKLFKRPYDT